MAFDAEKNCIFIMYQGKLNESSPHQIHLVEHQQREATAQITEVHQRLLWQPGTLSDRIKQKMEIRQDFVFNDWLFLGGAVLELRYSRIQPPTSLR